HTHNVATRLEGVEDYTFHSASNGAGASKASAGATFMGYRRRDGRVATRNEIWILCTVGCVARTAERIARIGTERFAGRVAGVEELVRIAEHDKRQACPVSSLVIGLKCGGSDGFSGLTANPLVGCIAD